MNSFTRKTAAALFGAGLMLTAAPAFAGEWRLDRSRCPDVREDRRDARLSRRDEQYDHGRRDGREDRYDRRDQRRDRAITVCPRSAFYVAPDRKKRHRADDSAPRLTLRYDRDHRLYYRAYNGIRIFVRA